MPSQHVETIYVGALFDVEQLFNCSVIETQEHCGRDLDDEEHCPICGDEIVPTHLYEPVDAISEFIDVSVEEEVFDDDVVYAVHEFPEGISIYKPGFHSEGTYLLGYQLSKKRVEYETIEGFEIDHLDDAVRSIGGFIDRIGLDADVKVFVSSYVRE